MGTHSLQAAPWRAEFTLSSDFVIPGERAALFRAVAKGRYVRLARGVFMSAERWSALSYDERYLALVRAVALVYGDGLLFSHYSAAALWRLPMVGQWPAKAHSVAEQAPGGRSDASLVRHCEGLPDRTETIDGLTVTPLARSLVDMGRTSLFGTAVAMMDFALRPPKYGETGITAHRTTIPAMYAALDGIHTHSGSALCRQAIGFADGASGSPGESISRVAMNLLGLTPPILQQKFVDADGTIGYSDFYWPEFKVIGEFDGLGKYLRDEYLQGRTTAEAVIEEKKREDRLRALGFIVVRWGWDEARSLPLLRAKLVGAGVR